MRDNVITVSKVTEEQPLHELLLPRDAATRLCFFSLPLELLSFYRERVFPMVEDLGFVPVTGDDVITPGDNISAKLDALIDRSAVMVTELTSSWTVAEFRMAIARIKDTPADPAQHKLLELIVIITDPQQLPPPTAHPFHVLRRPEKITDAPEGFIADLEGTLRSIAGRLGVRTYAEPQRLLEAKEYRAAVISAMTFLEARLREHFGKMPRLQTRRLTPMRSLVDQAVEAGIIPQELIPRVHSWMRLRNEAVHFSSAVSRAQAIEVVNGVLAIILQI
jgi:hypothetical protein